MSLHTHHPCTERRGFLLGVTLNELTFMLFFLLVLISAHLLDSRNREIADQSARLEKLEQTLRKQRTSLDESFKNLGALETTFNRLQEMQPRLSPGELESRFKRLIESEGKAEAENQYLRGVLNEFAKLLEATDPLSQPPVTNPNQLESLRQLLARQNRIETQNRELSAQIQRLEGRYAGSGLDHLPCWTDARSGEIEYLYRIVIFEDRLRIDAAWPASRNRTVEKLPIFRRLANRTVQAPEFSRLAAPVLAWSRRQKPECRHFVRIQDHESTSKTAFKKHLRLVETFFYKFLEPDRS